MMSAWMHYLRREHILPSQHQVLLQWLEKGQATGSRKRKGCLRSRLTLGEGTTSHTFALPLAPQSVGLCDHGLLRDCKTKCVSVFKNSFKTYFILRVCIWH